MITNSQSNTSVDEIADGIYRIHTPVDIPVIRGGFSFNQYLILDDEPVLFHTGLRRMHPLVTEAISKVVSLEKLRHIGYSHFEADECGAMNELLAAAPNALPVSGDLGAMVSMDDFADRKGLALADGEVLATGRRRLQWIHTPHVPHGWDCGVFYEETSGTLLCGDLFTQPGMNTPAVTTEEVLTVSEACRGPMDYFAHGPATGPILDKLAALNPRLLACMHGSAYQGDGAALLRGLKECVAINGMVLA